MTELCSDFNTIYNFRRELFEEKKFEKLQDKYNFLIDEINLTTKLVKGNPKSYPIWIHRQFCVE